MINVIRIAVKFDEQPSLIFLDNYSDKLITAVDDYCDHKRKKLYNRSSEGGKR
jgi:hypothetical protein